MSWPTRIVFGPGALARLPAQVERLGMRRPLVVTDPGVVKAGHRRARARRSSRARGSASRRFEDVNPNPTERDAAAGLAAFRAGGCDGLVAIGGGSSLDAAKLVQVLTTHEPPLSRYDDAAGGDRFVQDDMPPLIAIPTTAGTGSEVGRSGVATLPDTGRKTVIFSPFLMPKAAICDPELTVGPAAAPHRRDGHGRLHALPRGVRRATASTRSRTRWRSTASAGWRARCPSRSERRRTSPPARDMMMAAMQGAMAFQKGLGACHALAHALTPISGLHHGLANASCCPR